MKMNGRRSSRRARAVDSTSISPYPSKPYLHSSGLLPPTHDYPGVYDFAVLIGTFTSTKNKWAYSQKLSKLYIVWHQVIPLEFRWVKAESNLVVRAVPLYTEAQDFREPVLRCLIHRDPHDSTNEEFPDPKHVIRSENPGAVYEENPESGRCSVVVPLGEMQPGMGTVTVTYKFMCKTSCVTGMMRRPVVVVFTLERPSGEVLGRQIMGVKVCSCPRRDMEKEEEMIRREIKSKVKREYQVLHRLQITLPNLEMFRTVLEFNHGGVTSLLRTTPITDPRYGELTDFLATLEEKISYLSQWDC